jgi:hypothetical protein
MTDKERFELIWQHYHQQIDENRAIHVSLTELREKIKELENALIARTN